MKVHGLIKLFLLAITIIVQQTYADRLWNLMGFPKLSDEDLLKITVDQFNQGINKQNIEIIQNFVAENEKNRALSTVRNIFYEANTRFKNEASSFLPITAYFSLSPKESVVYEGKAEVLCEINMYLNNKKSTIILDFIKTNNGWALKDIGPIVEALRISLKEPSSQSYYEKYDKIIGKEFAKNINKSIGKNWGTTFIQQDASCGSSYYFRRLNRTVPQTYLNKSLFANSFASDVRVKSDGSRYAYISVTTDPTWSRAIYGDYNNYLKGTTGNYLGAPRGVAAARNGRYYITDGARGNVVVYYYNLLAQDPSMGYERTITGFSIPNDICYDDNVTYTGVNPWEPPDNIWDFNDDRIWVVDSYQKRLHCLVIGTGGIQPVINYSYPSTSTDIRFNYPVSVAVGKRSGTYIPQEPGEPWDYTVNSRDVYVVDAPNTVYWFQKTSSNTLIYKGMYRGLEGQQFISADTDPLGNVYILDKKNGCILKLDKFLNLIFTYGTTGVGQNNDNTFNEPTCIHNMTAERFINSVGNFVPIGTDQLFTTEKWTDQSGGLRHQIGLDVINTNTYTDPIDLSFYYTFTITDYARVIAKAYFKNNPGVTTILYDQAMAPGQHIDCYNQGYSNNVLLSHITIDAYSLYKDAAGNPTIVKQCQFNQPTLPPAPANVFSEIANPQLLSLNWTDNCPDEDGYSICWRKLGENYATAPNATVSASSGNMSHNINPEVAGLLIGNDYYFAVRTAKSGLYSEYIETHQKLAPPYQTQIDNFEFTQYISPNYSGPCIQFSMVQSGGLYYDVERKTGATGDWETIGTLNWLRVNDPWWAGGISFRDMSISLNNAYFYRVKAVNAYGQTYSEERGIDLKFQAPTGLAVAATGTVLSLSWVNNVGMPSMWCTYVYMQEGSGEWTQIGTATSGVNAFTIDMNSLAPLTTYSFRVASYCMGQFTDYSNTVQFVKPNTGFTEFNNSRRLYRGPDNALHCAFYNQEITGNWPNQTLRNPVYYAHSTDNGGKWTTTNPGSFDPGMPWGNYGIEGKYPIIGKKGEYNYIVRMNKDSLLLDSLGPANGFGKLIQLGHVFNPSFKIDSQGSLHCVWADSHLTYNSSTQQTTITVSIKYSKRTGANWSSPVTMLPQAGMSYYPMTPMQPGWAIYMPRPSVTVNNSGAPIIAWEHQSWGTSGFFYSLVSLKIYASHNLSQGFQVSTADGFSCNPCLACNPSGFPALTWQQNIHDGWGQLVNKDVMLSQYANNAWASPVNISENGGYSEYPSVSIADDASIHVAWQDQSQTEFIETERNGGAGLELGCEGFDGDKASVVWLNNAKKKETENGTKDDIYQVFYRRMKNGALSDVYRLTNSQESSTYPALPEHDISEQTGFIWTEGNGVRYMRLPDIDPPAITVNYPNGGEILYAGRRYTISWSMNDNRGVKTTKFYYATQKSPNGSYLWVEKANLGGEASSYSWSIPFNVQSTACRIKIVAIDSSGNVSSDSSDADFTIRKRDIITNVVLDALAYNNANKLALSADGKLHLCYTSGDSVSYSSSSDKGFTWSSPALVGAGQYPTVAIDSKSNPTMAWVKQWTPEAGGGILISRYNGESWTVPETLSYTNGALWDYQAGYSPPSMTIRNDTVSLVYELAERGGIPPVVRKTWRLHHARFPVERPMAAYTALVDSFSSGFQPPWENPTSASIATDGKGNDHIAWHLEGSVYYAMRSADGLYADKVQLSGGGARNPFVSVNGAASVVYEYPYGWAGQNLYDVYLSTGYGQVWSLPVNLTNNQSSGEPTICGTEAMWTGGTEILSASYDADKMAYAQADNLSCSDLGSYTPHAVKRQTSEGTETYRVWTEELAPDSLWSLVFYADVKPPEPLYAVDAGGETPSVFTVERDGYIDYNQAAKGLGNESQGDPKTEYLPYKSVDYDTNELVYRFFSLEPKKKYDLLISFYQETGQDMKLKPCGGKTALGEVNLPSGQEVVMEKNLPAACYKDGELLLKIKSHKGPFAVCGKILVYGDAAGGKLGGAQSLQLLPLGVSYIYALYQNYPNPMKDRTSIHYQLKKPGKVAIKVYNAPGQVVKTLVDESLPAGYHRINWDGRNDQGKRVSAGVYFYKIKANDFTSIKKMTIVR